MVLNASALPLHHSDLLFFVPFPRHMTYDKSYHHREVIKYIRSEWCRGRALALKTIGRGFAPRQRFVFFTRRLGQRVSIYQSYYGREETSNCRSAWGRGKALAFKTIGRGFAPRQSLSFSHVDLGNAFQFINNIIAERRLKTTGRSGVGVRLRVKKTKRCRGANPQPVGLNASALPLHHSDLQFLVSSL